MISLIYVLFAIFGLSFLIFIHELGHYIIARRAGMRVETFSIGFGKPIYSWQRQGIRWQVGWLLFGGYVKIAGMEGDEKTDPYKIADGFFGKPPLDRIKVALAGPLVNIVFALVMFFCLWTLGGREKPFAEHTHKIGWIDPHSALYLDGIRPGDEITSYNDNPYEGSKDSLTAPMMSPEHLVVKGYKVNHQTGEKTPFEYQIKPYPHPLALDKDLLTAGILNPASYIIYDRLPNGAENPLPPASPLVDSGIQYGDRVVWVDGEPIYSIQQLSHVINQPRALLTIVRNGQTLLKRVPRIETQELRLNPQAKEELIDWQFEAQLNGSKIQNLYTIPYDLSQNGVVEEKIRFIDKEKEAEAFPSHPYSDLELALQPGDKIIAVDGQPVEHSYQIFAALQNRYASVVVERMAPSKREGSWSDADRLFDEQFRVSDLNAIVSTIGTTHPVANASNLHLLQPITPKMRRDFEKDTETQAQVAHELKARQKELESIEDPDKRAQAKHYLDERDRQVVLGMPAVQDLKVQYNPGPLALFYNVFEEIWHTLEALVTGSLSPKWMSGPIGIVQVVYDNSMSNWKEGLYWLGAISLNLGILNLLPLPVLDGGTICFSLYEWLSGRQLKAKTLEKLIIPFALLLIGFFIFLTYHDVTRVLKDMF